MPITGFKAQAITMGRIPASDDNSRAANRTRKEIERLRNGGGIAGGSILDDVPPGMVLDTIHFSIPPKGERGSGGVLFLRVPTGGRDNTYFTWVNLENDVFAGTGYEFPNFKVSSNTEPFGFLGTIERVTQFSNYEGESGHIDFAMCDVRTLGVQDNRIEYAADHPSSLRGVEDLSPSLVVVEENSNSLWGLSMTFLEDFGGNPPSPLFDARKGARFYEYNTDEELTGVFGVEMCIQYYNQIPVVFDRPDWVYDPGGAANRLTRQETTV